MSRLTRTLTAAAGAAGLSAALVVAPSPAVAKQADYPETIKLPNRSQPEGIAAGPKDTFFAGARSDGSIYTGDIATGKVSRLVKGDGEPAVGMIYDERSGLLWVAGGGGGDITAYDASTGNQVFRAVVEGAGFLNDVVVTDDAVYVTDSFGTALTVVALGDAGVPTGEVSSLPLIGYVQPVGFGANGIRTLPTGDLVLVSGGVLYSVDPVSGAVDVIEVTGGELRGGDGLELDGQILYVVNGDGGNEVVELSLAPDFNSATYVRVITETELDRPTTGALIDGALYVVNGRFGVADQPQTKFYVTRLGL